MVSPRYDCRSRGPTAKSPDISADCIGSMALNSWAAGWLREWRRRRLAAVKGTLDDWMYMWKTFDWRKSFGIRWRLSLLRILFLRIVYHEFKNSKILRPRCGPTAHGLGSTVSNRRCAESGFNGSARCERRGLALRVIRGSEAGGLPTRPKAAAAGSDMYCN